MGMQLRTGIVAGTSIAMTLVLPGLPVAAAPTIQATVVELTASDGDDQDAFGSAVAVDGDTMVIAASCDESAGGNCDGSAYVFVRSAGGWVEQAKLVPSDIGAFDEFGHSVAVDGDTVVVGSWSDDVQQREDAGSAYVFVRTGATWTEQAKLIAPDRRAFDSFGGSVSVDGDTAVVGSYNSVGNPAGSGSAYVFVRSGAAWSLQTKLVAADRAANDFFGVAVAVSANFVLVGAQGDDVGANRTGSAYAFQRSGTVWTQQAKLSASDAGADANFGASVALDGRNALIGDQPFGGRQGSAYVFVRTGTTWTQQAVLNASDGSAGAFGFSVDISGGVAVVGAYADEAGGFSTAGSAYVFLRSGSTWRQLVRLTADEPGTYEQYGQSVAVDRGTVVVGALGHGVGGTAFVYQR